MYADAFVLRAGENMGKCVAKEGARTIGDANRLEHDLCTQVRKMAHEKAISVDANQVIRTFWTNTLHMRVSHRQVLHLP